MKKIIISAAVALVGLCTQAQVNSPADDGYCCRGILMFQDKNYIGCIDQMQYLKSQSPTEAELEDADFYIALSSAHLGKADAEALLKHFIWRHSGSSKVNVAYLTIGDLLLDREQYGDALTTYAHIDPSSLDSSLRARLDYNKAFCLMKRGEYERALPLYRALTASKEYGNGARFYQGYIAYVKEDYRTATDLLRGVNTATAPGNMADYYLSQIYYMNGDYGKASTTAKRLLERDVAPEFKAEAARVAGESLYHLGDDAQAIPLLRKYVDSTTQPLPSALYILGVADYRSGNYADAIDCLTSVAGLDNAMGQSANLFIGQSFMQQKNYSSAMIAFEKAQRMYYDEGVRENAFYNYAVASTQGGKLPFGSTVDNFELFLRSYPNSRYANRIREYLVTGYMTDNNYSAALASINAIPNPSEKILAAKQQVLYTLGTRELAANDVQAAITHLTEAKKLASYNPQVGAETDLWLGEALYAKDDYAAAANNYLTYLSNKNASADNRPVALYDLAYARFSDKRYDDAATDFQRFLDKPGSSPATTIADAYNRLADCQYYNKQFDNAYHTYAKAYSVSPANGDYALFQGALMKGYLRDHNAKIEGMNSMIERFPNSSLVPSALIEIGESYEQLRQLDKTIETYALLAGRYPATKQGRQASLLLALTYLNNNNRPMAIEAYKDLITRAPKSDEAIKATENLKLLMAEDGNITEYAEFIQSVPGAEAMEPTEIDRLTFTAAEREYLASGMSGRLVEYLDRFPAGEFRAPALNYALRASLFSGDSASTLKYATDIVDNHPDSEFVVDALRAKADAEYAQGKGELALATYSRLAESSSSPAVINEARIGMLRSARDLGRFDDVINVANTLTATSTLTDAQRSEARFSRAQTNAAIGNEAAALSEWVELSKDLNDIYGTKAAFYIADHQFRAGDLAAARTSVDKLINSDSPYDYWYARAIILLSDINRAEGNVYEADVYLTHLRDKYPGTEIDIMAMIAERLGR